MEFATKPELALAMLGRALDAGVPAGWVAADEIYGQNAGLRLALEERGLPYVLAVPVNQYTIATLEGRIAQARVDAVSAAVPAEDWRRLSAGAGAKGPRLYDWAYLSQGAAAPGWCRGLLIRRSPTKPEDVVYYLVHAPEGSTLAQLARVAGTRWTIESCFEAAKSEVGLDQYEVRSWTGWHRHITLAMLAHAYLAVLRKARSGAEDQHDLTAELLPLAVPEVRRLL